MTENSGAWFFSRMLALLFLAALTVLVFLLFAVQYMNPTTRTQVFYLESEPRLERKVSVEPFKPDEKNRQEFIKLARILVQEYVEQRESYNAGGYQEAAQKWAVGGPVYAFSSPEVYEQFTQGDSYKTGVNPYNDISKTVIPTNIEPLDYYGKKYRLNIEVLETDKNTLQTVRNTFTIDITLDVIPLTETNLEELDNPLGIRVVGYEIMGTEWDNKLI